MNFRAVAQMLGVVLVLMAGFLAVPAAVGVAMGEPGPATSCALAALVTGLVGGLVTFVFRGATRDTRRRPDYFRREGLATVGLAWLVGGAAGALPFLFEGTITSPVDAFFESVSGLTTTGSTVMTAAEIDGMPAAIAFWRSFSQWLGGFGIVMVFVVIFPTGGRNLFRSEVPGISREAGHQRVRDAALMLMKIYLVLSVTLLAALMVVGLPAFDAVLHTFTTVANGGFSNHSESIAYFDSATVEAVLVVFMLLSALNFAIYDTLIRVGPRPAWRKLVGSLEVRLFLGLVVGASLLIAAVLWSAGAGDEAASPDGPLQALRLSVFHVVCQITTAGYATADFDAWPQVCRLVLMLLALCGACAGSTSGGLKLVRLAIAFKAALVAVRRFARPRVIHQIRIDGQVLDESVVASVTGYLVLWLLVFLGATMLLGAHGIDLETSSTAVLVTLNNVGPGLGAVGPAMNFGDLPGAAKFALSICMVLGRLEFYALVALLMPTFWRR
ncbi:MAG: TrkH family potassium uptake protein [Planctomycetota bacterium]|jgi:trk system potassium uptake protein TrkH